MYWLLSRPAQGRKKLHVRQSHLGAGAMEGCVCEELAEERFVFQMGLVGTVLAQEAAGQAIVR